MGDPHPVTGGLSTVAGDEEPTFVVIARDGV